MAIGLIVIVGPTASGKSNLGIKIARKFKGEVISADSRQVYRGLDIGTGKVRRDLTFPVPKLKIKDFYSEGIRHHLIDIANPKKQFTASDFKKLGNKSLSDIARRSKLPIIVGGTGFYIDILLGRMSTAPVPPNPKLRAQLEKQSAEQLYNQLLIADFGRTQKIDRNNKRRLIRALEIVGAIGKIPPSPLQPLQSSQNQIFWLGIRPGNLKTRIKKRLDKRIRQGMIKEIENLRKRGVVWKRLNDLGLEYRWISKYLKNKNGLLRRSNDLGYKDRKKVKTTAKNLKLEFKDSGEYKNLLRDIVHYSKRQMTWFKRNKEIRWVKNFKQAEKIIRKELI